MVGQNSACTAMKPESALRRLLANGPLTGMPTRRDDAVLLLRIAASRFAAGRAYREAEVNDVLRDWLATFSAPHGIDHVSMRRYLADAGYLLRDSAGAQYRLNPAKAGERLDVDLAALLEEIRASRAARKRAHAT